MGSSSNGCLVRSNRPVRASYPAVRLPFVCTRTAGAAQQLLQPQHGPIWGSNNDVFNSTAHNSSQTNNPSSTSNSNSQAVNGHLCGVCGALWVQQQKLQEAAPVAAAVSSSVLAMLCGLYPLLNRWVTPNMTQLPILDCTWEGLFYGHLFVWAQPESR